MLARRERLLPENLAGQQLLAPPEGGQSTLTATVFDIGRRNQAVATDVK
jgi:hypothetical protein